MKIDFVWTDGSDEAFKDFYKVTENYYSQLVGGIQNRKGFVPYNILKDIHDVLIAYEDGVPVACGSFKEYDKEDAEIKRVWVNEDCRGKHIAKSIMEQIEERAKSQGYKRAILQTREIMTDAVGLYTKLGYHRIANYPPYNHLDGAVCFAKEL